MPLYSDRTAAALYAKSDDFKTAEQELREDLKKLREAQAAFENMSKAEIEAAVAEIPHPGALPTWEQDEKPFIIPFGHRWTDHREARDWAAQVLSGVITFAADGSTVPRRADLSIPVGLVQVGWFANPHDAQDSYVKDVEVEVLSPKELTSDSHEPRFADLEIEWRRYLMETERDIMFMGMHANKSAVVFLDGTLTISFVSAQEMWPYRQKRYLTEINRLIDISEEMRVPIVGYVDASSAGDLTTLIRHVSTYEGASIPDSTLLRTQMQWGDRCRTFICARDDEVPGNEYYREKVCFTYLKTTQNNPPARLEIPRWVFDDPATYEWVLDVVRAECVVGLGYPYPIETADAAAVLTAEDRERFYRMFQEFAEQEDIPVRFSRKSISKRGRR